VRELIRSERYLKQIFTNREVLKQSEVMVLVWRRRSSSVGNALDSHAGNLGSRPCENILFVQMLTAFQPVMDILGNQRRVHLIPCLCGMGCKRSLVLEMEVRVSIYLIITRLYIAINELMGRKTIFSHIQSKCLPFGKKSNALICSLHGFCRFTTKVRWAKHDSFILR